VNVSAGRTGVVPYAADSASVEIVDVQSLAAHRALANKDGVLRLLEKPGHPAVLPAFIIDPDQ
jgi:hypothetical protein